MTLEFAIVEVVRDSILAAVVFAEWKLVKELQESRKFMEKMQDNILAAMGLSMAVNTGVNLVQAWFRPIQGKEKQDTGEEECNADEKR